MTLNKIRLLDEYHLLQSLEETGYHEIKRILDGRCLNGRKLLELSEFQTRPWKLSPSQKTTLFDFIKDVTENPSLIIKPEPVNKVYNRTKVNLPPKPQLKMLSNLSREHEFKQLLERKIGTNCHFTKPVSPPPVPEKPTTTENNRTIHVTKYCPDPTEAEYYEITQEDGSDINELFTEYNHPKQLVPRPEIIKHDPIPIIFTDKAGSSHNKPPPPSLKCGIKRNPLPPPIGLSEATRMMHPKSKRNIEPLLEYNNKRSQNVSMRPNFLAIPPALPPENIDLKELILTSEPVIIPAKYPTNRLSESDGYLTPNEIDSQYLTDRFANMHSQNKGISSSLNNLLKIQFYDKANNCLVQTIKNTSSTVNFKLASKLNKEMTDEEEKIAKTPIAERPRFPLRGDNRPKSLEVGRPNDCEIRDRSNSYDAIEQNREINTSESNIRNQESNTTNLQQITNKATGIFPTSKHKWKSNDSILGNTADDHSRRNWLGNLNKLFAKNKATKVASTKLLYVPNGKNESRPQEGEKVKFRDRPLPPIPTSHKIEWNPGDLRITPNAENISSAPKKKWNNVDLITSNTDNGSSSTKIEWNPKEISADDDDDDFEDNHGKMYEKIICGRMSPDEETNLRFGYINDKFFRDTDLAGAKKLLRKLPDGAFLFRPDDQFLVLTLKYKGQFYNLGIESLSNYKMRISADTTSVSPEFRTLRGFVDYFTRKPVTFRDNDDSIVEICLNPILTKT